MSDRNRKKLVLLIGLILLIISLISMHIAMILYPGGTYIDGGTVGYTWWHNFFSDLGMVVSHSGAANPVAFVLFTISIIATSVAFIAVFSVFPSLYADSKKEKWTSILGTVFGIAAGIFLFVVTFVPEDIYPNLHGLIASYMYLSLIPTFFLYFIATLWNKDFSLKYTLSHLSIVIVVFLLSFVPLFIYPDPFSSPTLFGELITAEGLFIYVVGQKILHYTLWTGMILMTYGAWKRID